MLAYIMFFFKSDIQINIFALAMITYLAVLRKTLFCMYGML